MKIEKADNIFVNYNLIGFAVKLRVNSGIQLALRDSLAKEGFKYDVKLESAYSG